MSLGKRIADMRKQRGWTQAELAERLEMNPTHVSRWEQDHIRPRQTTLEKLAEVFGVDVGQLVAENGALPQTFFDEDPELAELVAQLPRLNSEQRVALRTVLRSMLTCQQIGDLIGQGR